MTTKLKIHLITEIDNLKSNWGIWQCQVEDEEGNLRDASVQSNGYLTAEETLEYDDE